MLDVVLEGSLDREVGKTCVTNELQERYRSVEFDTCLGGLLEKRE